MIAALYTTAGFEDLVGLIIFAIFALIVNALRKAGGSKPAPQEGSADLRPQASVQDELNKFLESISRPQEQVSLQPPPVIAPAPAVSRRPAAVRARKIVYGTTTMRARRTEPPPPPDDMPHERMTTPIRFEPAPAPAISAPMQLTILHSLVAPFNPDEFRTGDSLRKIVMGMEILGKPIALRGPRQ